jgi:hypothetical protein
VWSRVTPLLLEAGHEVIPVDLPGDDEAAALTQYADLVVAAIGSRTDAGAELAVQGVGDPPFQAAHGFGPALPSAILRR